MEALKEQGNKLFNAGKFSAAVDAFTEAIVLAPSPLTHTHTRTHADTKTQTLLSVLYSNRALAHKALGNWEAVFEDAQKSRDADRFNPKAHYLLGVCLCRREHWREGVRALEAALEMAKRQKRPAALLTQMEEAIALYRADWHDAAMMDERTADAHILSYIQGAFAYMRDARVATLRVRPRDSPQREGGSGSAGTSPVRSSVRSRDVDAGSSREGSPVPARGANPIVAAPTVTTSDATATRAGSRATDTAAGSTRASSTASGAAAAKPGVRQSLSHMFQSIRRYSTAQVGHADPDMPAYTESATVPPPLAKLPETESVSDSWPTPSSAASSAGGAASAAARVETATSESDAGDPDECPDAAEAEYSDRMEAVSALFADRESRRSKRDVPDYFCCGITFDVMLDPVCTPSGHSYERRAIEKYLTTVKQEDPQTRAPLEVKQLVPNLALKNAIQAWLNENPWAHPLLPASRRREE